MTPNPSAPIGIFDSGIGGLTVVQSVMDRLPDESIIYFGDTARVPYGVKSEVTIQRYAEQITRFLVDKQVKMVLIACNTVSAVSKDAVKNAAGEIPVLDVIAAGTHSAIQTGAAHIGVIGTLATINSDAYRKALNAENDSLSVKSKACPLLVPLAEEGWTDNEIANQTLRLYLTEFMENGIETLILGCTHYPLFISSITAQFSQKNISIIDSGDAISEMAAAALEEKNLLNNSGKTAEFQCFVSDRPQRFQELAERFLGKKVENVSIHNF